MAESTERDLSREPFFWAFVVVAVIVGVLAFTTARGGGDTDEASFVATEQTQEVSPRPTAQALPTPQPTAAPTQVAAVVELTYSGSDVIIAGVVPAQAVGQGIIAAAGELVAPEAVVSTMEVDPNASLSGTTLVIMGEVADDADRSRVLGVFGDLGLTVEDRLILAGSNRSLADVVAQNADLSQFNDFLMASGVAEELAQPVDGGFTLFAPTNAAVTNLDSIVFDELGDAEQLRAVLEHHLIPGSLGLTELGSVSAITSVQGESVSVANVDGVLTIGEAVIVGEAIEATNGIVYVVDAVLLPGTLRTEVALNQLVTLDPILFASGSATILEDSFPILNEAALVLAANPLGRVEIQGHTDTDGPGKVNLELSQDRADAVAAYLVEQGIDAARLTATGYGERQLKVDPEETDEDKAANRRIEFRVT